MIQEPILLSVKLSKIILKWPHVWMHADTKLLFCSMLAFLGHQVWNTVDYILETSL